MSPRDEKVDLLRSTPLFARLGRRELERLSQLTDEVDLPEGRVLMRQGDSGHEMFILVRGRARIERDGQLIGERGDGEVLGEMALFYEAPRRATVTLSEASRLIVVGHRDFHTLLDEIPEVRTQILEILARRLYELEPDAAH